ncbi:TPA: hypothetical protein MAD82_000537 [Klebsiella pneumoniae]|uniref:hypothetical protein n=1 Tax=Klebsiella pneumoniae TaxID=573 RepID=UPI0004488CF4|nr:hypothetical protein [Klebsiella pneumoniae]EWF53090.1 hypothetical protein L393_00853 [Klebsiella pneumoniae MGH 47]HBS2454505.1 hypothetical protein [Klebsiella pneumoniae]HBS2465244.1 hypothetical protein [Klebsiella pneumoniae]HBS2492763.1 hypothetical protein [Klebsiella pneumoniae]HBS2521093.1 hypothetical protein [Klebsiella pneumoniae]
MTITLQAVNELIASLESAGELSIREQKFLKLAKEFRICSASLDAAIKTGNVLADQNAQLTAENVELKDCVANHAPAVDHWNAWADPEDKIKNAPETPATDRIVAGIKADGVEEFVSNTTHKIFDESDAVSALSYLSLANAYVKQLREGADK